MRTTGRGNAALSRFGRRRRPVGAAFFYGLPTDDMKVLVIDPDATRATLVADGIRAEYGGPDTLIRQEARFELRMLRDLDPDMVIIAC